ncbi:hypothetical protein BB561_002686 [Smittium simulii]|uniref:Uncharacterized protein n=1 Tax=Smittium simulii TaxID=133385 RepID=A0A2T9YPK7_9FUNG|nr:hypothetical protein BB561_002686 [Smittium simulii]
MDAYSIDSTDEFCNYAQKSGGVIEYKTIFENTNVSAMHATEVMHLPFDITNPYKTHTFLDRSYLSQHEGYISNIYIVKNLSAFFNGEYLKKIIKADTATFNVLINNYLKNYSTNYFQGAIKLDDINDFMIYILHKNAHSRVFGIISKHQSKATYLIEKLTQTFFLAPSSKYKAIEIIKKIIQDKKMNSYLHELSELIYLELQNQISLKFGSKNISILQLIKKSPQCLQGCDKLATTMSLLKIFRGMVIISPSRLTNILNDISLNPSVISILNTEQAEIITKYGTSVNIDTINKMSILHNFITNSLLSSSPASFLFRKLNKDITLSTGQVVKKNNIISFNIFGYYSKKRKYQQKNIEKSSTKARIVKSNIANKKKNKKHLDLLWGYGSNACPFYEYSLIQMKIIIICIIRTYDIYAHVHETNQVHPGYTNISTVVPKSSSIVLKLKKLDWVKTYNI